MPFIPGLVSITFRKLEPPRIIDLVTQAGLRAIEWGGDIHAPPADLGRIREVATRTRDAGLEIPTYGSYFSFDQHTLDDFRLNLEATVALGAPMIRVWAGMRPFAEFEPALTARMIDDARSACELAREAGVSLVPEWHGNSLLETPESAHHFLESVDHPSLQTFWQPHRNSIQDARLQDMDLALPRLRGLHVFHWHPSRNERFALTEGKDEWMLYLNKANTTGRSLYALLEYVRDDEPRQFLEDAATLKEWLKKL